MSRTSHLERMKRQALRDALREERTRPLTGEPLTEAERQEVADKVRLGKAGQTLFRQDGRTGHVKAGSR